MGKRLTATIVSALAVLLVGAMTAWACTNLATLNLSKSAVQPGETIRLTGSSFKSPAQGGQPVQVHWGTIDGPVLVEAVPGETGSMAASLTVPADASPGHYALVATQLAADPGHGLSAGENEFAPVFGTPARAAVMVGSPAPFEAEAVSEPLAAPAVAEPASSGVVALMVLLGVLGIGLFGAGLGLFVREIRRRAVPARAPEGRES